MGAPVSTTEAFLLGGLAACCAVSILRPVTSSEIMLPQVTVSNPAEVAKTRLQLQGELTKDGGIKVYRNTFDVLVKTARNEGIRGVQRGLGAAVSSSLVFPLVSLISGSTCTRSVAPRVSLRFY